MHARNACTHARARIAKNKKKYVLFLVESTCDCVRTYFTFRTQCVHAARARIAQTHTVCTSTHACVCAGSHTIASTQCVHAHACVFASSQCVHAHACVCASMHTIANMRVRKHAKNLCCELSWSNQEVIRGSIKYAAITGHGSRDPRIMVLRTRITVLSFGSRIKCCENLA